MGPAPSPAWGGLALALVVLAWVTAAGVAAGALCAVVVVVVVLLLLLQLVVVVLLLRLPLSEKGSWIMSSSSLEHDMALWLESR